MFGIFFFQNTVNCWYVVGFHAEEKTNRPSGYCKIETLLFFDFFPFFFFEFLSLPCWSVLYVQYGRNRVKTELIIAADVSTPEELGEICRVLPDEIVWYKVGLELFTSVGLEAISILKKENKKIFLDLKLHDIPRTVARAVKAAASQGVDMLTVHASGGRAMLEAAAESVTGDTAPLIVAVTALTSLDENDLKDVGVLRGMKEHTMALGALAVSSGIDGLVCSPRELTSFRDQLGNDPVLVAPGVRPTGAAVGDQKRVATPSSAVKDGASFLVVGRPIMQSDNPFESARSILAEIYNI
ncbi:MAG: orotidine-5'-phosphate decarboxylase [Kiritimatiellae bacterium]|nr:orotidine-5'-phosphate decarboxylase [Kiritimatiellia bacterium]